jgi:hypothetical protein
MMRSDMPKQIQAYRNGGGLMSLATVPMETEMAGQPHRLAYINPEEEELLLAMGGAGEPGPGGIVSYFLHNQASRDKIKSAISKAFGGGGSSNDKAKSSSKTTSKPSSSDDNKSLSLKDQIMMGFGLQEKTDEYRAKTEATKERNRIAAEKERQRRIDDSGNRDAERALAAAGGGGGGASTVVEEVVTTPTNVFEGLTDEQVAAQSDYIDRVATYMGQYTEDDLSSPLTRRSIYGTYDFKPKTEEFMAITGADEQTAQALLGSVSRNDLRDWSKIMASDNPLEAAQAATAALYLTPGLYGSGQIIAEEQFTDNSRRNIIGETDQLYAYTKGYSPFRERYGADNIGIGIKTADGIMLTDLGSISSPTVGENLARFGYGSEDLAELIDPIRQYYTENFEFNPSYYTGLQKVSDGRYVGNNRNVVFGGGDARTDELSQILGQDVVIKQPDGSYAVMDTFGLGQGAISGENIDPFGIIGNLQTNMPQSVTPDLELGQGYLFQTTPGFYGLSPMRIMAQEDIDAQDAAIAKARADEAAAAEAAKYSSGQPVMGSAGINTGLQNYSALVPAAGTSTAGIAGLPSTLTPTTAQQTPYAFTAYNPGEYNPVIGPLTLPPLG